MTNNKVVKENLIEVPYIQEMSQMVRNSLLSQQLVAEFLLEKYHVNTYNRLGGGYIFPKILNERVVQEIFTVFLFPLQRCKIHVGISVQ